MPAWIAAGYEEYARRMPREMPLRLVEVKAEARNDDSAAAIRRVLEAEAKRIRAALPPGSLCVVLDERGALCTTAELAGRVRAWRMDGRRSSSPRRTSGGRFRRSPCPTASRGWCSPSSSTGRRASSRGIRITGHESGINEAAVRYFVPRRLPDRRATNSLTGKRWEIKSANLNGHVACRRNTTRIMRPITGSTVLPGRVFRRCASSPAQGVQCYALNVAAACT
jgi:hypothetical protein